MTTGRRRAVGFLVALLIGVALGLALWPMVQRELMVRRLFEPDRAVRDEAALWWRQGLHVDGISRSRLAGQPKAAARICDRLEEVEDQAIFVDVASLLRESDFWRLEMISTRVWARRLGIILESGDDAAAESVLSELVAVDAARDDEHVLGTWEELLSWSPSADIRRRALLGAASWFGRGGVEAIAAAAREDEDARVRRLAWLLLGHIEPSSGYAGRWRDEAAAVAEAMLWAATVTNRDDASALLMACDDSPWPTAALPWLLSRSDDPRARSRLESLVVDGNRNAALHLAERWGEGVDRLPSAQQAWLGTVNAGSEAAALHRRWAAWRNRRAEVGALLDDPVAEDDSVWAAVLLAERVLDDRAGEALGREWVDRFDEDEKRAGMLLLGLCRVDEERLVEEYRSTKSESLRRSARLALNMIQARDSDSGPSASERAYGQILLFSAQVDEEVGSANEILMALLACGDAWAAEAALHAPGAEWAGATMLERAWLIERFLPEYAKLVGPLCPWNGEVAQLQFDIMAAAFALGGGAKSFDHGARVFRYAAATPSR